LSVTDNAYGAAASTVIVGAAATVALKRPLGTSFGWYDLSIRSTSDSLFLRRIAGHVETGAASRTDPQIGTNRLQQIALSAKASYVQKGMGFALAYAAPAGKLDARNWIGLYGPGASPGKGNALAWAYATQQSGSWVVNTAALAVADYNAWYLYQDGYEVLGGPLPFCVTELYTNSTASVVRGSPMTITFAMPASRVREKNWIGLWTAGAEPGAVKWVAWKYITVASGSVSFDTAALAPGDYAAWMLFDDGYQRLGGPCGFTVQ
jgi:phospholipase C